MAANAADNAATATYPVIERVSKGAHVSSMEQYKAMYKRSVEDPEGFFSEFADKHLTWIRKYDSVQGGDFTNGRLKILRESINKRLPLFLVG